MANAEIERIYELTEKTKTDIGGKIPIDYEGDEEISGVRAYDLTKVYTATSSTAAATAAKVCVIDNFDDFALVAGARIYVTFTNANTASSIQLRISYTKNGVTTTTDAKNVIVGGNGASIGSFAAGRAFLFIYNGSSFDCLSNANLEDIDKNYLRNYKILTTDTKRSVKITFSDFSHSFINIIGEKNTRGLIKTSGYYSSKVTGYKIYNYGDISLEISKYDWNDKNIIITGFEDWAIIYITGYNIKSIEPVENYTGTKPTQYNEQVITQSALDTYASDYTKVIWKKSLAQKDTDYTCQLDNKYTYLLILSHPILINKDSIYMISVFDNMKKVTKMSTLDDTYTVTVDNSKILKVVTSTDYGFAHLLKIGSL